MLYSNDSTKHQLLLKRFVLQSKHELVYAFYLLSVYSPHMQEVNNAHALACIYHAFSPLFLHMYVRAQLAKEKDPTSMQRKRGIIIIIGIFILLSRESDDALYELA